ncbi:MAG: class I SAM-dependent methyltransferase [Actinomycetota bacterium]
MHDEERRHLGSQFDRDAEGYDAGRPDYPAEVYGRVLAHLAVGGGDRVLEVGPGTGQATGRVLATGAAVHAVEPGAALADVLRQRHGGDRLTVEVATLEDADPEGPFDAVASATAFHWVDPEVGLPILHRVLRPGGRVALWWNVYRDPSLGSVDPVDEVVRSTTELPNTRGLNGILDELDLPRRLAEHGFVDVEATTHQWTITHDEASLLALFSSFSDMRKREPAERRLVFDRLAELVRANGGMITRPCTSPMITARTPS